MGSGVIGLGGAAAVVHCYYDRRFGGKLGGHADVHSYAGGVGAEVGDLLEGAC